MCTKLSFKEYQKYKRSKLKLSQKVLFYLLNTKVWPLAFDIPYPGTALGFQIDGAADFLCPKPLLDHKFLHPHGFVKVVDAISQKIDGAFTPCPPL